MVSKGYCVLLSSINLTLGITPATRKLSDSQHGNPLGANNSTSVGKSLYQKHHEIVVPVTRGWTAQIRCCSTDRRLPSRSSNTGAYESMLFGADESTPNPRTDYCAIQTVPCLEQGCKTMSPPP